MLRSFWKENQESLRLQRNMALWFALGLLITNILLGIKIYQKYERVIIVPAHIKQSFWAEGESFSKEYLEEMTVFFANLLLNVTADSFAYQRDMALKYVSPEYHNFLYQRLIKEEEELRKQSLSTTFRPKETVVNLEKGEVEISGLITHFVADKKVRQEEESYKASYTWKNGILLLNGFEVKDDK